MIREYLEEMKVTVKPLDVIEVCFNMRDWYIAFRAEYVSGEATSDHDENNEVLWLDVEEALVRDDVPGLTKKLIESALRGDLGLHKEEYNGSTRNGPYSLYCL